MHKIGALFAFLLISCGSDKTNNPVSSLPLDYNTIQMSVGDSWLFQRRLINTPVSGVVEVPDTVVSYSYFSATKDTSIDGKTYIIIDGRNYEIEKDTVLVLRKRSAIHLGDTVLMYEFNTGSINDWSSDLLKRQMTSAHWTPSHAGSFLFSEMQIHKMSVAASYDTSVFYDFVYPVVFPLTQDSAYVYRDAGDPRGSLYYQKRFLGTENVETPLGQFPTYKFEYLVNESMGVDSMQILDWVGVNGVVKRYMNLGYTIFGDSLGNTTGRMKSEFYLDWIGKNDIDPDTLKPWGRQI